MLAMDTLYLSQLSSHIIHHFLTTLQSEVIQQTSDFMAGLNVTMHVEYDQGSRAVFVVHQDKLSQQSPHSSRWSDDNIWWIHHGFRVSRRYLTQYNRDIYDVRITMNVRSQEMKLTSCYYCRQLERGPSLSESGVWVCLLRARIPQSWNS